MTTDESNPARDLEWEGIAAKAREIRSWIDERWLSAWRYDLTHSSRIDASRSGEVGVAFSLMEALLDYLSTAVALLRRQDEFDCPPSRRESFRGDASRYIRSAAETYIENPLLHNSFLSDQLIKVILDYSSCCIYEEQILPGTRNHSKHRRLRVFGEGRQLALQAVLVWGAWLLWRYDYILLGMLSFLLAGRLALRYALDIYRSGNLEHEIKLRRDLLYSCRRKIAMHHNYDPLTLMERLRNSDQRMIIMDDLVYRILQIRLNQPDRPKGDLS